jgi:hypothetical protein
MRLWRRFGGNSEVNCWEGGIISRRRCLDFWVATWHLPKETEWPQGRSGPVRSGPVTLPARQHCGSQTNQSSKHRQNKILQKNFSVQISAVWKVRKFRPLVLLKKVKCRLDTLLVTCSSEWYFMTSINYEALHYAVFFSLLSVSSTCTEMSFLAPNSRNPSPCLLPLI